MLRSRLPTDKVAPPEMAESTDGSIPCGALLSRRVLRIADLLRVASSRPQVTKGQAWAQNPEIQGPETSFLRARIFRSGQPGRPAGAGIPRPSPGIGSFDRDPRSGSGQGGPGRTAGHPVNRILKAIGAVPAAHESHGRIAGQLLGAACSSSTVDALVVAQAVEAGGTQILTGDREKLERLAAAHPEVWIQQL